MLIPNFKIHCLTGSKSSIESHQHEHDVMVLHLWAKAPEHDTPNLCCGHGGLAEKHDLEEHQIIPAVHSYYTMHAFCEHSNTTPCKPCERTLTLYHAHLV